VNDERFDQEIRDILRVQGSVEVPGSLVDRMASIPDRQRRSRRLQLRIARVGTATGALTVIVVLVVGAVLIGVSRRGSTGTMPPTVSSTESATPSPTGSSSSRPEPVAPGTFQPTGSMTVGRAGHTATALKDGRVLICGGQDASNSYLASAELYDPTTGKFSPTGSMAQARMDQTATLLGDGRVLVTGGLGSSGYLSSAELYDPTTGKFSPTGSMAQARSGQTATLLSDGRVLIAGGFRGHTELPTPGLGFEIPETLLSAELFDPTTGTFHSTGSMTVARGGHTATLLPDGRVLIAGGSVASAALGDNTYASAELYNPVTGRFSPTGSMAQHRSGQTATLLSDGRVLIAGGWGANLSWKGFPLASAELYDPRTGTFSQVGSMTTARNGQTATLLADGRVLVTGGANGSYLDTAELYDPNNGTFAAIGPMTAPRFGHAVAILADGRVLITGGNSPQSPNPAVTSAELFEP
jgi:hypothetical protein